MDKPKKEPEIKIPLSLFNDLIDVLDYIDVSNYTEDFQNVFEGVLDALQSKKKAMQAREAYSGLITANKTNDEGKKFDARINYLQKRN